MKYFVPYQWYIYALVLFSFTPSVSANSIETAATGGDVESYMVLWTLKLAAIAFALLVLLILIAMGIEKKSETVKKFLFYSMVVVVCVPTIVFIYNTVYINTHSWTGGPVHWHADYEVWACGSELDLVNPEGFSNKIGTAPLHEHNDQRIHYEGVAATPVEATLGNYFKVIGGKLDSQSLEFHAVTGDESYTNGDTCPDGATGTVQAFVYTVNANGKTFSQKKLTHPEQYIMSRSSQVPPGDCIIVEFGPEMYRTNHLCESYKTGLQTGKLSGEVYD